ASPLQPDAASLGGVRHLLQRCRPPDRHRRLRGRRRGDRGRRRPGPRARHPLPRSSRRPLPSAAGARPEPLVVDRGGRSRHHPRRGRRRPGRCRTSGPGRQMSFRDEIQRHLRGEIAWNVPLANRTSLRVGGSADALLRPEDAEDLRVALAICRDHGVPVSFLGGGANTLLSDEGVEGVVVRLPVFAEEAEWDEKGATFTLGAGAPIARIPQLMRKHGLVGGEFLAGIPGTIGGATAMNAGTREGEFVRVVSAVELVSAEGARWFERDELDWTYRRCHLPEGGMVTRVRIRLRRADEEGLERSRAAM